MEGEKAVSSAPRVIPGLAGKLSGTVGAGAGVSSAGGKQRSRSKKTKTASNDVAAAVESDAVAATATAPQAEELSEALVARPEDIEEEKKTSAVEAVNKRIRAANKKLVSPIWSPSAVVY